MTISVAKRVGKYTYNARKAGKLIPTLLCERCGEKPPTLGHHTDYNKPLEVMWLCEKCHKAMHPGSNQIKGKPHFNQKRCRICGSYYEGLLQPCPACLPLVASEAGKRGGRPKKVKE